jgi:hypothetical protein
MLDSHLRLTPFVRRVEIFNFKTNKFEINVNHNPIIKFSASVCELYPDRIKRIEDKNNKYYTVRSYKVAVKRTHVLL